MVNEYDTVLRAEHCGLRNCHQGWAAEERACYRLHFLDHKPGQRDRTTAGTRPMRPRHADVLQPARLHAARKHHDDAQRRASHRPRPPLLAHRRLSRHGLAPCQHQPRTEPIPLRARRRAADAVVRRVDERVPDRDHDAGRCHQRRGDADGLHHVRRLLHVIRRSRLRPQRCDRLPPSCHPSKPPTTSKM